MRVTKASFSAKRNNGIDIKISNGRRDFTVSIDKENLVYEDLENNDCYVKVYSMIRNCCASCPLVVLETGSKAEDDIEIAILLKDINLLIGDEIKNRLV